MKNIDTADKVAYSLLIGGIALLFLLFLMGPVDFSNYLIDEIVWFFLSAFFIVPLVKTVINRSFDRRDKIPVIFGITGMFFYSLITQMVFSDWLILFLQTTIVISMLSIIFAILKEELRHGK